MNAKTSRVVARTALLRDRMARGEIIDSQLLELGRLTGTSVAKLRTQLAAKRNAGGWSGWETPSTTSRLSM